MGQHSLDEQFQAAVEIVQNLPKEGPLQPSIDEKLRQYSLFKQATIGPCNIPQPYMIQVESRLKWYAWNALGDMSKDEAMATYIDLFLEKVNSAEEEHDILEFLSDPQWEQYLHLGPLFRKNFAILGRTTTKAHAGKTVEVNGKRIEL